MHREKGSMQYNSANSRSRMQQRQSSQTWLNYSIMLYTVINPVTTSYPNQSVGICSLGASLDKVGVGTFFNILFHEHSDRIWFSLTYTKYFLLLWETLRNVRPSQFKHFSHNGRRLDVLHLAKEPRPGGWFFFTFLDDSPIRNQSLLVVSFAILVNFTTFLMVTAWSKISWNCLRSDNH